MKVVNKWITDDGEEFASREEARLHELKREMRQNFGQAYAPNVATNRFDSVLMAIEEDPVTARDILNKFIRSLPKKQERISA